MSLVAGKLSRLLGAEALTESQEPSRGRSAATATVLALASLASPSYLLGAAALGAGALVLRELLRARANMRQALAFETDFPALMFSLSTAIRCGVDPMQALLQAEALFAGRVLGAELAQARRAIERGESEDRAISAFGAGLDHPELPAFRLAFILARRQGSSLTDTLRRLARVTRQRQSFRRKIRAALASQRLSAAGIGGCALIVTLFQCLANPAGWRLAMEHPAGSAALAAAASLCLMGLGWMGWLSRERI